MGDHKRYRSKIENYILAYNNFNVDEMLRDVHEDLTFQNVTNGEITLRTQGIEEFKNQAEMTKALFQEREQKIGVMRFHGDVVEVEIDYTALLAKDLSSGLKAGEIIHLKGKSVFVFKDDKILSITDLSF